MKINWQICNHLPNGINAYIQESNIMLTVYKCNVDGQYVEMVWIAGKSETYSKSSHSCCIAAMVHAEIAAYRLMDELAAKSAIWQEV